MPYMKVFHYHLENAPDTLAFMLI